MPKVIKPGNKEFIGSCRRCGCEFSYTLEEFMARYPLKFVNCPECGDEYYHPDQSNSYSEPLSDYDFEKMVKDSLNVFKQSYKDNQCPVCGFQMVKDTSMVLTTYPPQYRWFCPHCNHSETRYEQYISHQPTITTTNAGTGCEYEIPVSSECSDECNSCPIRDNY